MNPLLVSVVGCAFAVLGAALSAMTLGRFSSVETRLGAIENHFINRHRGE